MIHHRLLLLSLGLLPFLIEASPQGSGTRQSKSGNPKYSKSTKPAKSPEVAEPLPPPPPDFSPEGIELWRPQAGAKFQIVLGNKILRLDRDTPLVPDADIFDVDLWHTPQSVIEEMKRRGKKVICYFSAGGSEVWRPDNALFPAQDVGDGMAEWPGENWLNIRSPDVWSVMESRIKYAYDKGCNAIDPDNLDAFNHESKRGGGFSPELTGEDSIRFLAKLSNEAAKYGMSTGLKNIEELIERVHPYIHFAVNEECASMTRSEGCAPYHTLLQQNKPVFHIEYVKYKSDNTSAVLKSTNSKYSGYSRTQLNDLYCQRTVMAGKKSLPVKEADLLRGSTVIKLLELDGWSLYCDGTSAETATTNIGVEYADTGNEQSGSGKSQYGGRKGSDRSNGQRPNIQSNYPEPDAPDKDYPENESRGSSGRPRRQRPKVQNYPEMKSSAPAYPKEGVAASASRPREQESKVQKYPETEYPTQYYPKTDEKVIGAAAALVGPKGPQYPNAEYPIIATYPQASTQATPNQDRERERNEMVW